MEDARVCGHWNSSEMPVWLSKSLFIQSTACLVCFSSPVPPRLLCQWATTVGYDSTLSELGSKEHSFVFLVHSRLTAENSWLIRGNFGENNQSMNLRLQSFLCVLFSWRRIEVDKSVWVQVSYLISWVVSH